MIKIIKYFLQAIFIYIFFFIGRILGINIGRKISSFIFTSTGPLIRSKKIVQNNLRIFSQTISTVEENKISLNLNQDLQ